ncbi:MAG TPA: hypothetical protein VG325_07150 [Solirubrobacteraceae bacterium]|nr:hypothetical protein [Solirubrobacteraceae bacterium]
MSDIDLLALHGLAIKKSGSAAAVAEVLGLSAEEVQVALDTACADGRAAGAGGTFMVTPAGRTWLDERYAEEFAGLRQNPASAEAYEQFERINRKLLALMTDWQMMPAGNERIPNDHSDADYDADIVDQLGALHERAERPLGGFAELEPRLGRYRERLEHAYDRVLAGEHGWISGARIDSYHTCWYELHEDLLRLLGRQREEPS